MKKVCYILVIMVFFLTSCAKSNDSGTEISQDNQEKSQEDNSVNDEELLTVEELKELSGVDKDKYSDEILEKFINEFELTRDNVGKFNVSSLLEGYEITSNMNDVSSIFDDTKEARISNYTKDVVAIAFFENMGTSTKCVYYDIANNCRYKTTDVYLFSNLNQVEPEEYTNGEELVSNLDNLGVFSWKNVSNTENIEDAQSSEIAFLYADGTVFKVSASGVLSQILPESYSEVKGLLFD